MTTKRIKAINDKGNTIAGKVVLIYNDAIVSGTNEYVQITKLLIEDDNGNAHIINPRDVVKFTKKDSLSELVKSKKIKNAFKKQVELDTWGKGLPMVYMNDKHQIVRHWKDGKIEIIKEK